MRETSLNVTESVGKDWRTIARARRQWRMGAGNITKRYRKCAGSNSHIDSEAILNSLWIDFLN